MSSSRTLWYETSPSFGAIVLIVTLGICWNLIEICTHFHLLSRLKPWYCWALFSDINLHTWHKTDWAVSVVFKRSDGAILFKTPWSRLLRERLPCERTKTTTWSRARTSTRAEECLGLKWRQFNNNNQTPTKPLLHLNVIRPHRRRPIDYRQNRQSSPFWNKRCQSLIRPIRP